MVRRCEDCVWSRISNPNYPEYMKCAAPQNNDNGDLIARGAYTPRWFMCHTHREDGFIGCRILRTCGREGRWFSSKNDWVHLPKEITNRGP